ncbi:MAG: AAA family ATPase [Nocardioidaceae bacterium]
MSTGLLVAVGTAGFEASLLNAATGPTVHVVRRCVDLADLLAAAAGRQAQAAVVSVELAGLDTDVVQQLYDEGVVVVGMTAGPDSADEAALRRFGIGQVLSSDEMERLPHVVSEAVSAPGPAPAGLDGHRAGAHDGASAAYPAPGARGRVLAVWGPNGAPGRSVVTLGLAAEFAKLGAPTLAVDADVYGGALAQLLGMLDESSGLLAATRSAAAGQLDVATLAGHARGVGRQLRVLTGLPRADRWTEVRPALLRNVLESARPLSAFTVVDCGFSLEQDEEVSYDVGAPRRNGATLAALEVADTVLVVGRADPVGLGRLVRGLAELSSEFPGVVTHVLVNQMRPTLGWSADDVTGMLAGSVGAGTVTVLPYDRNACDKAVVHGQTLTECAPESKLAKALRQSAAELAGVPGGTSRRRRGARAR